MRHILMTAVAACALLGACGDRGEAAGSAAAPEIAALPAPLSAEGDFGATLQAALISATPGQTIVMPAGTFKLAQGLSLDVDGVVLRGAGQDQTILDFSGQTGAGEGLLVTSDDVTLMDFGIRDTKGDGIKSKGADRITYRYLTVDWSGEPKETNGAYGIYPVEATDVLVDRVTVRGASDAGIYVGQSERIIVRDSLVEFNVAGIEIENSKFADVYGNVARDNTGGILVFDLPDLPMIGGHSTRIFKNEIIHNNTRNFAPPGNIVAGVPSGTGVIILANENVQVFENNFADNRTTDVLLTAYSQPFTDERYNPLPRNIVVRANTYAGGGNDPQGTLAPLAAGLGGTLPPIVSDGVTRWGTGEAQALNLVIEEAPEIGFLTLGAGAYPLDPAALAPSTDRPAATPVAALAPIVLPQDNP